MIGIRVDAGKLRDTIRTFYLIPSSYWNKRDAKEENPQERMETRKGRESGEGAEARTTWNRRVERHACLLFGFTLERHISGVSERAVAHLFLICK